MVRGSLDWESFLPCSGGGPPIEVVPLRVTLIPDAATPLLPLECAPEVAGSCVRPLMPVSMLMEGPVTSCDFKLREFLKPGRIYRR